MTRCKNPGLGSLIVAAFAAVVTLPTVFWVTGSQGAGHAWDGRHGASAQVSGIVAVSGSGLGSRSEERRPSAIKIDAVAALHMEAHQTANRSFVSVGVGAAAQIALDLGKNPLRWTLRRCR